MAVLRTYADFSGRARRQEYWMFVLINALIGLVLVVLGIVPMLLMQNSDSPGLGVVFLIPFWLYNLALIIPSFAVSVRRLHDVGKSGLWILIAFIPLVGPIVLLVFHCTDSEPGPNLWGPSPKYGAGPGYGYPAPYPPQYPPAPPPGY
jgi:uncharacterized membrane protein YhaH (DUF805 family)